MNRSAQFLLPMIEWGGGMLKLQKKGQFKNLYIGYEDVEGHKWGNFLYLHLGSRALLQDLIEHNDVVEVYTLQDGYLFKIAVDEYDKEHIVKPFINGKYSQICADYIETCFPKRVYNTFKRCAEQNRTVLIFEKSEILRGRLIEKLNPVGKDGKLLASYTHIPEGAEVESSPNKKDEIFNFTENCINYEKSNHKVGRRYVKCQGS